MVGVVTDHPVFVFCQPQAVSSKAFNAMLALEKKVLLCRSVGDNTDREQKSPKGLNMNNSLIHQGEKTSPLASTMRCKYMAVLRNVR